MKYFSKWFCFLFHVEGIEMTMLDIVSFVVLFSIGPQKSVTTVLSLQETNRHHPYIMLSPNRKISYLTPSLPLLSSLHLFLRWGRVRSQGGLRAGTSLSAAAGLAPAATEGLKLNARVPPSTLRPSRCRWLRFSSASLPHNNTPFVAEGHNPSFVQSTLIYGTHIFQTHILLHKLQRHKLSKRWRGSAGRRIQALSLFEKWYKSFTRTCNSQIQQCIDFQNFKELRETEVMPATLTPLHTFITFLWWPSV